MARVKLSPLLTDISGSIGGMTVQRNKFGITLRQKPIPLYKFTPAQITIRAYIATIQAAWQNLTDAERLQWNRFLDYSGQTIKHDRSVKLSGHGLYLKYQLYCLLAGLPLLETITYLPPPSPAANGGIVLAPGLLTLQVTPTLTHTDEFFLFFMSNTRTESQAISKRGLRYMYVTPATAVSFDITDSYIAAFGLLPLLDSWYHYSILTFSVLAPVFTGKTYGREIVEA